MDVIADNEYLYALQTLLLPVLQEFQPTLILISAGFDAAAGDDYGGNLSPVNGFGRMTTEVLQVANKLCCPVIASLEGGYKQSVLGPCVASVVQSMVDFGANTIRETGESSKKECVNGSPAVASNSHYYVAGRIPVSTDSICPTAAKNVEATRSAQQKYWKCLSANHPKNHERGI